MPATCCCIKKSSQTVAYIVWSIGIKLYTCVDIWRIVWKDVQQKLTSISNDFYLLFVFFYFLWIIYSDYESILQKKSSNLKIIVSEVIMNTILTIRDKLVKNMAIRRKLWLCLYIHESNLVGAEKGWKDGEEKRWHKVGKLIVGKSWKALKIQIWLYVTGKRREGKLWFSSWVMNTKNSSFRSCSENNL